MEHWSLVFVFVFLCLSVFAQASLAAPTGDEAAHQALREMRDAVVNALNKGDMEAVLPHLHKNIVFTAMNGEVCRGHDVLRAYFNRMMKDPGHIVESLSINPTVDRLTDLYGGTTGVVYGSSVDHYKLTNGMEFDVNARWSATMVWKTASGRLPASSRLPISLTIRCSTRQRALFTGAPAPRALPAWFWVCSSAGVRDNRPRKEKVCERGRTKPNSTTAGRRFPAP